jgi:hypothetical protein
LSKGYSEGASGPKAKLIRSRIFICAGFQLGYRPPFEAGDEISPAKRLRSNGGQLKKQDPLTPAKMLGINPQMLLGKNLNYSPRLLKIKNRRGRIVDPPS